VSAAVAGLATHHIPGTPREFNIVSYTLLLSLIEFKTLVMREQLGEALGLLPSIPAEQRNGLARFLEAKGLVQEALDIATDQDYRWGWLTTSTCVFSWVLQGWVGKEMSMQEALDIARRPGLQVELTSLKGC
jgi:hypothetical protein